MNFELTEDQKIIQQIVQEFFQKEWSGDHTREIMADSKGYDPRLWKEMTELGYTRLIVPEIYEGTDGDFLELTLFMEEMGKHVVPSPFFTTACQCMPAILEYGSDAHKAAILPRIGAHGEIWSFALNEICADYDANDIQLTASEKANGFVLNGIKLFVPYANSADYLLVVARTEQISTTAEEGISVFMVATNSDGIDIEEMPTAAPGVKCKVRFNDVAIPADAILGSLNRGWEIVEYILEHGAVLKAAEMAGGAQAALGLAVRYAKERIQFDRPIGSFQAIQHRLVNMLKEVESLRKQVYEAAWNISVGSPSRLLNASAKAMANEAYHRVCFDAVAIHGAIGWTREMDVSLYLLRSKDLENDCGGLDFHKEWIAAELEKKDLKFLLTDRLDEPVEAAS
ncbi:MAG: acyl-CoA/acyl-ACP dehydrogenase [Deltaproteobacteria bacterium]|nr:acyl-CoA/acyl-ACP dehydrogenase [Deltaproteobacteria bacterium]